MTSSTPGEDNSRNLRPEDLVSGFTGAFTWSNIGLQIGNGLISGGAGFVLSQLLSSLLSTGESMQDMMQQFADEIVGRLTEEMKTIINEAIYQNDLEMIKSATASLAEKYSAYVVTGDVPLLDGAVQQAFDVVETAIGLGIPALGIFVTAAGLKMCLCEEKAKTNDTFHQLTLKEIDRDSTIIDQYTTELLAANERAVSQFRSCRNIPDEGRYCIITVNGVTFSEGPIRDEQSERQHFVDELDYTTNNEIITPARAIEDTWKRFN